MRHANAARIDPKYWNKTYRDFVGYENLGVDWENFPNWLREKYLIVISGKSFSGKTALASIMMMHVIAEFISRFPFDEEYQFFKLHEVGRYDDLYTFLDTKFAVFDRPDLMSDKMADVICERYDDGLLTIVTSGSDASWFTERERLASRYERARTIFLV